MVGLILPVLWSMASLFPVRGSVVVSGECWSVARVPELIWREGFFVCQRLFGMQWGHELVV